jgi:hypothetical protein
MTYNLTFMENSTNLLQITQAVNTASGGLYGALFILVIWMGTYAFFSQGQDPIVAFVGSSVLASTLGIMLLILQVVTWQILVLPMICVLLGIIVYGFTS